MKNSVKCGDIVYFSANTTNRWKDIIFLVLDVEISSWSGITTCKVINFQDMKVGYFYEVDLEVLA